MILQPVTEIIENLLRQRKLIPYSFNVATPDSKLGAISIYWHKGHKQGFKKITVDLATRDEFPWRPSKEGRKILENFDYHGGRDLISGYVIDGLETEWLEKLFELLNSEITFISLKENNETKY